MDGFLTTLYFEKFENINREKQLRSYTKWSDDDSGKNANIRNDQSISETRKTGLLLDKLIDLYIDIAYSHK